ncbi:MAG: MFS transporter [Prevotella sp.]|nr:MFS transporter [Prevotella sp.]
MDTNCQNRKLERLWNRNYIKVMTANFALFFAFYVLTPLLPLYLSEHFGATKDVIGLVLSGYTITTLLCRPFSGYLVDSFPRKTVLMISFGAFAIFFAGYLAASTLFLFLVVRTLHGGPFGALTVSNSTVAIDVLPSSRRTEGIGYYGLSNNLAMAIAPTVGIFLYQFTASFELLFWLAFIVACLGWLVDATVDIGRKGESGKRKEDTPAAGSKGTSNLFPHSSFRLPLSWDRFFLVRGWLLGLNMVAFGFSFGVLSNYLAIYGKEVMGITGGTGTYFMLCSIGLILSRLQGGKALREGRLTFNAGSGMVISLVGYTIFIALPALSNLTSLTVPADAPAYLSPLATLGYYGSALLIGLGNGHMWPAFQIMTINVATNNQRGTANSTILISWDIGMGLGILVGGVISELVGYGAAFWTVVVVNAAGVACFFLATKAFFLQRNLNPTVR